MKQLSENKNCQNCKKDFTIEPEDFLFYEKIKVPPPTFCPECRMVRRMAWRNVRNLYKRTCCAFEHNEDIVSLYSKDKSIIVYDQKYWWSDGWDPMDYGVDYDFSKSFFLQFFDLLKLIPFPNLSNVNPINTKYASSTVDSKNCYLIFSSINNENCCYSESIDSCKNCLDVLSSHNNEYVYESIDVRNCFNIIFCIKSSDCLDSMFLYDCRNCSNCFGCWNLRNKKYCIFNEQFSKEEYFIKIKSFNLNSYFNFQKIKKICFDKFQKAIMKFSNITNSKNVSGNNIEFSKNCHNAFDVLKTINSNYIWRLLKNGGSDSFDISIATKVEHCYEGAGIGTEVPAYNTKFAIAGGNSANSSYIQFCQSNCSNLFACIGLRNKQYCILNKQYTKEEYEELVPKIIEHMNNMPYIDSKGRVYKYGEFFPPELSPFAYNETIAQEYFPLTKEEALKQGYKWKDREERNYTIDIYNKDIPDDISNVDESIINKVIECTNKGNEQTQCTEAFKIIPDEYQFYKRMNLPLPRLCPNCRHYARLKQRNPLKLWHRSCMKEGCTNQFETSYAPDRPEIVYCEDCYKREIY